jgi:CRISPR type III-B/RAMP module-associated protein Cmr5
MLNEIERNELRIAREAKKQIDILGIDNNDLEFVNFLKGLPSNIMQNGLLQTFVFVKGKKDEKFKKLFGIMQTFYYDYLSAGSGELLTSLTELDNIEQYIYYQNTFIAFSVWLKRFALAKTQSN